VEFLPEKRRSAPIATVTASEVERFRAEELKQGKSAVTANFAVKAIRAVFNSARRKGLTPTNPAEAVELMPEYCEERVPFRTFTNSSPAIPLTRFIGATQIWIFPSRPRRSESCPAFCQKRNEELEL
jgi:hypothetical protein